MSTRLQVVMSEEELDELKAAARAARLTVSEWVRQALRDARSAASPQLTDAELEAVFDLAAPHRFPAPDIDQLNTEIVSGYLDR
jgi:hypothetical protein